MPQIGHNRDQSGTTPHPAIGIGNQCSKERIHADDDIGRMTHEQSSQRIADSQPHRAAQECGICRCIGECVRTVIPFRRMLDG
jgi:hypothetical protein